MAELEKEDGQAFPCTGSGPYQLPVPGMTVRQYYIGQLLLGMRAHQANESHQSVADWVIKTADAILEAENK